MSVPSESRAQTGIRAALAASHVFGGLPPEDLALMAAFSRLIRLDAGGVLFRAGEPSRGFFVVQSGVMIVHRSDAHGREQVIHRLQAGDSFAEASVTAPRGYPADARAASSATVVLVPKAEFLEAVAKKPELALRIMASLSRHVRGLVDRMHAMHTTDAETRLAAQLLEFAGAEDSGTLPTTRRMLAGTLGMAEETLSRAFARLRAAGLVETQGRRFTLRDRDGLVRRAAR